MANEQNLINNNDFTPSERRERARKAAKASAEVRAKNASIRKILLDSFHNVVVTQDENGNDITGAEYTAMKIVTGMKKGNIKFIEMYLAMIGQKPADNVNISGEIKTNKELENIMRQLGGDIDDGEN